MAKVFRLLLYYCVGLVLGGFVALAGAQTATVGWGSGTGTDDTVPKPSEEFWQCTRPGVSGWYGSGNSPQAACAVALNYTGGGMVRTYNGCGAIQPPNSAGYKTATCYYKEATPEGYYPGGGSVHAEGKLMTGCVPNSSDFNGACKCNAGYAPADDRKSCEPNPCKANNVASSGYYDVGPNAGASPHVVGCSGGCEAFFDGESPVGSAVVGGVKHWFAKGTYYQSGRKCSTSQAATKQVGPATATKPADTCAANQGTASMNGKTICVDQNGDQTNETKPKAETKTEKTTTQNPDGSTTTTETTTKTDGNGGVEKTVVRTTTRPDGSVTVEGETTKGGTAGTPTTGTDDGTDDGQDEEKGECEKNPSKAGCGGPAAAVGDLYQAKEKTMASVLSAASAAFRQSGVGSAVGDFFVVNGGGTCPTWQATIPYIDAEVTIDQFCSAFATSALAALKICLLIASSFFAFRVAVE